MPISLASLVASGGEIESINGNFEFEDFSAVLLGVPESDLSPFQLVPLTDGFRIEVVPGLLLQRLFGQPQELGVAIAGALFAAQSGAFSRSREGLGLDAATVAAEGFVSGLELAFLVGAAITAVGILSAWMRGSAPPALVDATRPDTMAVRSQPSSAPLPILAIERRAPQRGAAPGGSD